MKRCLFTLIALALLTFAACAAPTAPVEEPPAPKEPFPGKIAMITGHIDNYEEQYVSAQQAVEKYGADTAFFATNCSMQIPLIAAVSESGAIYPQPCCPSPYHGYSAALGLQGSEEGMGAADFIESIIAEAASTLKGKGALGRLSTYRVAVDMMSTAAGVEYAIKRLNGEAPKVGIDVMALKQCMEDYAGVECYLRPYVDENGVEYGNYLLVREDYLTYGEEHIVER